MEVDILLRLAEPTNNPDVPLPRRMRTDWDPAISGQWPDRCLSGCVSGTRPGAFNLGPTGVASDRRTRHFGPCTCAASGPRLCAFGNSATAFGPGGAQALKHCASAVLFLVEGSVRTQSRYGLWTEGTTFLSPCLHCFWTSDTCPARLCLWVWIQDAHARPLSQSRSLSEGKSSRTLSRCCS